MKKEKNFLKRGLSWLLVAVLLASNFSGLTLPVGAAHEHPTTVTIGQIVADNYNLSDAEKELLESGFLVSDSYTYETPDASDNLISVDTENAKITAKKYTFDGGVWVPTAAVIEYNGNTETVALTNGEGTYDAEKIGNAFSVKVTYQLTIEVSGDIQKQLLNAAAYLKQGIANLDAINDQVGNLFILEEAMPEMLKLANEGVPLPIGGSSLSFAEAGAEAIRKLNAQMNANGGKLNLSVMADTYAAGSKTGYLMTKGTEVQAEILDLLDSLAEIEVGLNTMSGNLQGFITTGIIDAATGEQVKRLTGIVNNLTAALKGVSKDPWTAANLGTDLVYADANYAELDELVAAIEETNNVTSTKKELLVASVELQANLSMYNVEVAVELMKVDASNTVVRYGVKTIKLTLKENATKAEILQAVADSGIEADAIAAWGSAYVAGKYESSATELPEKLTKDISYTITYSPVEYTVTIAGTAVKYPYGYQLTLPMHTDSTKAYDYFDADGKYYAQGTNVAVTDDLTLTRQEGKAYVGGKLLSIIAANYGNEKLTAILTAGGLIIDEEVNYREPSASERDALVKLEGNTLTADTYESDYNGLQWAPYSYVVNGNTYLFDGKNTVTITESNYDQVSVYYRLTLTGKSAADVEEILNLVADLVDEAEGQKSTMDRLLNYKKDMGDLTRTMLLALNGVVDGGGLHADPAKDQELMAYFKNTISSILANCMTSNGGLKLYDMVLGYEDQNNGGLAYYYLNNEAIRNEINILSGYLKDMLADEEKKAALATLANSAGYGHYVSKIETLGDTLADIAENLIAPNEVIDLNSEGLRALANALTMKGQLPTDKAVSPYVQLGPVIKTADTKVTVKVEVVIGGKTEVVFVTINKNAALDAAQIQNLKDQVNAIVNAAIDVKFYDSNYNNGAALDALLNVNLSANKDITYTYTAKTYTVKIEGEADQTISIENLTVKLPGHPDAAAGMSYAYTIDGKTYPAGQYTFTAEQLANLFKNGSYTITREEKNEAAERLENMVANMNASLGANAIVLNKQNGIYTGITANISAGDLMGFVMGLVESGYSYIGLNGEDLMYDNNDSLEISLQVLINAVLKDNSFGSNTLINLGKNGKGKMLTASMQLGNSKNEIQYNDLKFVINVTSVPAEFKTMANALDAVKNYVSFQSNNGVLHMDLNLPDAVYGAYLTALLATGHVDKSDMNAVDQVIAFQFIYDYLMALTTSDMDAETFTNTLAMLGQNYDLTKYNDYYQYFCKFLTGDSTQIAIGEDGMSVDISVNGNAAIDNLLKIAGQNAEDLSMYLNMVKEYKAGGKIEASASASLKNPGKNYGAIIVDLQADGLSNKFACTSSYQALANKTKALAGYSAMILLDDVNGDLTISGTTILDLNGKTITGSIKATGTLYIIDSSMDTYNSGAVTGTISGNVVIIAGNYKENVSAFLKDGYYQDGTTVRNALYYITDNNGDITFVINTDVMDDKSVSGYLPNVKGLALEIATDLLLNYATSAMLKVDGNSIYSVDVHDILGLLKSNSKTDEAINILLDTIDVEGISDLVNIIIADLIDFEAIYNALEKDEAVATYKFETAPWNVVIEHNTEKNYLTLGIGSNPAEELAKAFNVSLKLEGDNKNILKDLAYELSQIVDADKTHASIHLKQPTYANKVFAITGTGEAVAVVDMSKNADYAVILGVILAYGNPSKAADVAAAINSDKLGDLKAVVDGTSVAELFTALKAMGRNVDFAAMAKKVGITADIRSAAKLESVYHLSLCGAGKVLEKLEITGMSSKLGNLYKDGWYDLTRENMFREGEINVRSYSGIYDLTATVLSLKVKLFTEEEEHEHVFGDWIVEKEADCTEAGLKYRECACGEREEEIIPALGHNDGEWIVKDATCTEDGLKQLVCTRCGEVLKEEIIPALGHDEGEWYIVKHPTATEDGLKQLICTCCGEILDEEIIPATGEEHEHKFGEWIVDVEATCTEDGHKYRVCECGEIEEETIPAHGHEGVWHTIVEPTETEEGLEQLICIHCGEVLDEKVIPALGIPETGDIILAIATALSIFALAALAFVVLSAKRKLVK